MSCGSKAIDVTQILLVAALYLLAVNLATWGVFRHDQNLAMRGRRRIPELGLLALAALGGTPAAKRAQRFGHLQKLRPPTRKYIKRFSCWHKRVMVLSLCVVAIALAQIYLKAAP